MPVGGGVNELRRGGTPVRCSVWAIAGIGALAVVLSGCGQQGMSQSPYSPQSVAPASASQTQGVTPGASGSSDAGSSAAAPGSDGEGAGAPGRSGKAPADAQSAASGSGWSGGLPGSGGKVPSPGSNAQGSTSANDCPTAGVGGDLVAPPCPVAATTTSSDGIQGPATASPTTESSGMCPAVVPSPSVTPSPTATVSPEMTPAATSCPSP
jgi:hypothetical protein